MKKILLITSQYPNNVSTFITRDIEVLVENGYKVDLYALYPLNSDNWNFVPDEGKKMIQDGNLVVNHISYFSMFIGFLCFWNYLSIPFFKEIKNILKDSSKYGKTQYKKSLYTVIWTISLINKNKNNPYDKVISYWGNYSGTAAYLFSRYAHSKPKFYTYLHAGVDLYRDQIYLFKKLSHATKIFTVCEFNVEFLKKLFGDKFKEIRDKIIIYHLPLKIKPFLDVEKEDNKIVAVGRLAKAKGLDYLLEACKILDNHNISFSLEIVGGGEERENLEKKVDQLELKKKVSFTGQLPYSQVEQKISSSVVLAHCSPVLGDAVPTVIKESLSLGTPVVGSNIVGIPELLNYGECGLLFEPQNSENLALSLEHILGNKKLQRDMANKGRLFAEKMFDFNKNKKVLIEGLEC